MNRTVVHAGAGLFASSVTFVASLVLAGAGWSASSPDEPANSRGHDDVQARRTFASVPLSFEANHGQTDPSVRFLSRGREYVLFLTPGEAVLVLRGGEVSGVKRERKTSERSKRAALRMRLVGAKPFALVVGLDELPGKSQYFLGNDPRRWRTHVPQYARVAYRDIYPGIDLIYHGASGQLEYDFVLAPHARPSAITLAFDGVEQLFLDGHGDAVLKTGIGEVLLKKPFLYQETDGVKKEIDGQFVVKGRHELGLLVRFYDSSKPLIIDPTLSYSTYLGGNSDDSSNSLVVDSFGNTYVTGSTLSTNFPTTAGVLDTTSNGASDAFVTKLNTTGTALVYSTYLGGTGSDEANALAVDSAGNAYVTGSTGSTDFPTTAGVLDTTSNVASDAFVTKLNATGTALAYSTYLGGNGSDVANALAVDSAGNAYIAGNTLSTDFPTAGSPFQAISGGLGDAFVTKLNTTGTALVYSTYLGGTGSDEANALAVDSAGNAYVTGSTGSIDFPTGCTSLLCTPFATTSNGTDDVFVTKLNATGTAPLAYSTYLGGNGSDVANALAVDSAGNAYVTGRTGSPNFPTGCTPLFFPCTPFDTTPNGADDAFVTKLNTTGTALVYSTYLGGAGSDVGLGVAVDSSGNAHVTGSTSSSAPSFPTTSGAFQTTLGGSGDAFVTKLNATGTAPLAYSTYLGGNGSDVANALAVDSAGNAYVTGNTGSTDFPTTTGVFQAALGGTTDIFVAKIMESAGEGGGEIAGSGSGGWCFIATAAYGSPLASEVQVLREFRDRYLVRHAPGRLFVAVYYQFSPPLARMIADSKVLQATVRGALQPVIWWASLALASPPIGLMIVGGGLLAGSIIPVLAFRARRRRSRCMPPPAEECLKDVEGRA